MGKTDIYLNRSLRWLLIFEYKFKSQRQNVKSHVPNYFTLFCGYLRSGRPEQLGLLNGRSYFHCRMVFRVRTSPIYDGCSSFLAIANQHDLLLIMDINAACFGVNFRQNNYDHKGIKYYLLSSGNPTINALRRLAVSISNLSRCSAFNALVSCIFYFIHLPVPSIPASRTWVW